MPTSRLPPRVGPAFPSQTPARLQAADASRADQQWNVRTTFSQRLVLRSDRVLQDLSLGRVGRPLATCLLRRQGSQQKSKQGRNAIVGTTSPVIPSGWPTSRIDWCSQGMAGAALTSALLALGKCCHAATKALGRLNSTCCSQHGNLVSGAPFEKSVASTLSGK